MTQSTRLDHLKQKWQKKDTEFQDNQNNDLKSRSSPFSQCAEPSHVVKRFKLNLKTGRSISIPYSSLPILDLIPTGELKITGHNYSVHVKGRNLVKLYNWLSDECLVSLSESKTGMDSEKDEDLFVKSIQIQGSAFGE